MTPSSYDFLLRREADQCCTWGFSGSVNDLRYTRLSGEITELAGYTSLASPTALNGGNASTNFKVGRA